MPGSDEQRGPGGPPADGPSRVPDAGTADRLHGGGPWGGQKGGHGGGHGGGRPEDRESGARTPQVVPRPQPEPGALPPAGAGPASGAGRPRRRERPVTPDGRYFVARGRLCRRPDPALDDGVRRRLVKALVQARRAAMAAADPEAAAIARAAADAAKRALGERGPVWWEDGAPDEDGVEPAASRYAAWWEALTPGERAAGEA